MKKVFVIAALTASSFNVFSQSVVEVKSYIEDLIVNYQPEDYSYEMGFGDSFTDDFLLEFMPVLPNVPESLIILERCSNSFNLCRRNFFDLKGIRRILIKEEQGYITLRFTFNNDSFISTEYVKSYEGWDKESEVVPMVVLSSNSFEVAKRLRLAFIYLSVMFGGEPIEEDWF
ncbi:hypothetical protein [Roseivirga sp.]|uniref:hypothetical protein n=1 Tax=Roseivirga sp. TaxID=1964215 RepID=UPI003B8BB3C3